MSKNILLLFWIMWLLDVLMAIFGYREFIGGVFGRYAAPTAKYLGLWVVLLSVMFAILYAAVYFKNLGQYSTAMTVVAIPLVLSLPYVLFLVAVMAGGKGNWQ